MKNLFKISATILLSVLFVVTTDAQENINQEVKVIKAYVPVINDAYKISELPKIVDTNKVITKFNYEIVPVQYKTTFAPKPIKPARLISEPLSKLYPGQAKLGFGSYLSPLAEVHIGSKRSKQLNWNVLLHHNSSHGKVKNEVNEKVYAGLSNSLIDGQIHYFAKKSKELTFGADYANKVNYFYGYNPDVITETLKAPLVKDSIENQVINFFNVYGNWRTNYIDSSHVNYNIDLGWQTLSGKDAISENVLKIKTDLNYFFENEFVGADLSLDYYSYSNIDSAQNGAIVKFSPWIGAFGNKWRVVAGVNTFYDQAMLEYFFSPRVSMHYNVIDYFLIPYVELNGNYNANSYKDIYYKNNFINQTLKVEPTETKLNMTFGLRGNISSKVAFNAKIDYSKIDNQYFFVNDTSLPLQNKFTVVYDDISRVRILGEISYKTGEKLFLTLKGNFYQYNLTNEIRAWHMPDFTFSLNARYVLQNKIILNANVFSIGKRYVREFDSNNNIVEKQLQGLVDLNLGIEYRLSKVFSAFAYFNNISAVKYYEWNNYPSQQFNMILGVNYAF
jgi:hypothetical protein